MRAARTFIRELRSFLRSDKERQEIAARLRVWSDTLDTQCAYLTTQLQQVTDANGGVDPSRLMKYEKATWLPFKEARMPLWMDDDGNYQLDTYRAALELTEHRRGAIDVGANIGTHSRLMARDFQRVHAFEPNHLCRACLTRNVEANNCVIYPFAVSDQTGQHKDLCFTPSAQGGGTTQPTEYELETWSQKYRLDRVAVETVALDDLDLENIDLVKIDVQGDEAAVVKGMKRLLQLQRPVVLVETGGTTTRSHDAVSLLTGMGYSLAKSCGIDAIFVPPSLDQPHTIRSVSDVAP